MIRFQLLKTNPILYTKSQSLFLISACAIIFTFAACRKKSFIPDDKGNVSYNPYGMTYLYDLVKTKSGDLLLIGEGNAQVLLTRITAEGKMLWQKEMDLLPDHELLDYIKHSVFENEDGSILVFGTQSKIKRNNNLAAIKLNAAGVNLKTKTFFIATNDTAKPGESYSTYYPGLYTKDGAGGYFLQLRLGISFANGAGREDYIVHYNANDSFDLKLYPRIANSSYENMQLEMQSSMGLDKILFTKIDWNGTGYSVGNVDKTELMKGKLIEEWSTDFPPTNGWVGGYFDEQHFYNCNIPLDDNQKEIQGIQIRKLDMNNGSIVKEWMLPFKREVLNTGTIKQNWAIISDESFLYIPVSYDNYAYVIKAAKDGSSHKFIPVGGDMSRDQILKIALSGDQILVFGYSSLQRSQELVLCMYRINKNGEILDHEN